MTNDRESAEFERHVRSAAHQALIDREDSIHDAAKEAGRDPYAMIVADRLARWAKHRCVTGAEPLLREWAAAMASRFQSPTVRIWAVTVDWLTALAIARYGEAEDYWPDTFTADDQHRAGQWYVGVWVPEGVKWAAGAATMMRGRPS